MERQIKQSFVISVLVHIGFVALAIAVLLLENWLDKPEPVVFELVSAAAAPPSIQAPRKPLPETPLKPLEVPTAEPIKPLPDIPDLPEPPPPEPPKPKPKPEPKPEPVKTISAEEFFKNRKRPERVQQVQQKPRKVVKAPDIETNVRDRLEKQLSPIQIQGAHIGQIDNSDALQRYLADLRQRIQDSFEPSGSDLQAEAYFTVSATGRIIRSSIQKSSGDAAFDRSVLRTLQSTASPGPPPGNREYTFSLTFKSE